MLTHRSWQNILPVPRLPHLLVQLYRYKWTANDFRQTNDLFIVSNYICIFSSPTTSLGEQDATMPIPTYEKGHVVDCEVAPNLTTLKRKSVLVTGGSSCLWKTQK